MTRFTSSSMQALSGESLLAFRLLADVGVTSGYVYFCTGRQFLYYNANTYVPVNGLGDVSGIEEESDAFPRDVTMRLSGVNTWMSGSGSLYEPLRESMFNRPVNFYRAFLDTMTMSLSVTPELIWTGKISTVNILLEEGIYEVKAISDLRKTALIQYFNRETQRTLVDSSDTFFNHIDQIPLFKSNWGGAPTYFNGGPLPMTTKDKGKGFAKYTILNRKRGTGG